MFWEDDRLDPFSVEIFALSHYYYLLTWRSFLTIWLIHPIIQIRDSDMFGVLSSSAKQECLSWVAATADWDFEYGETNSEVIFAGP